MISRGAERQNQARPGSAAPRNSNAETPGHRRNLSRPQAGSPNGKAAHSGNMNAVNPGMMSGQGRGFSGAQRENGSGSSSSAGESSDSSSTEPNTGGLTADINNPEGDSSVVLNDSNTLQNSNSVAAVNNAADNKEFSPMSDNTGHEFSAEKASETSKVVKGPAVSSGISGEKSFDGFLKYAAENGANGFLIGLKKCKGKLVDNKLILTCTNPFHHDQITDSESLSAIKRFSKEYFGPDIVIEFKIRKGTARKSSSDLRKEVEEHPDIARVIDTFGASIVSVERRKK
jgi:DNA polymerase-3 subunit gamma/tau